MRFLYLGDIMGQPGREVVGALLPELRTKHKVDLVLAQAENVTHGKSMSPSHMRLLQSFGVDVFTGGNHTPERPGIMGLLDDPLQPVLAPLNQPGVNPKWGVKTVRTPRGKVLVISLLGTVFPNLEGVGENPLRAVDEALATVDGEDFVAKIVNFHGDFSSEKRVIGYYLDGRVSAVVGDHWHVPTADAMVLPGGTAHITDVGMCGTLHSSLGVSKEIIINRWRDGIRNKNDIADGGPYQLNGVLIDINTKTGLARSIKSINLTLEELG